MNNVMEGVGDSSKTVSQKSSVCGNLYGNRNVCGIVGLTFTG